MTKKKQKYERGLDLWIYQMPYESMTIEDVRAMEKYNIMMIRSFLENGDYLIGTWNSLINYMTNYLLYEMHPDYMKPMYVRSEV